MAETIYIVVVGSSNALNLYLLPLADSFNFNFSFLILLNVCTNLMVQLSRIHGHEIHVVLYACLDGDCRLY